MLAARKAPTLAWLLAALTSFLTGMAVTEGQHQADPLLALPPVGMVVTVDVTYLPTAALAATAQPTVAPAPTPCVPSTSVPPRPGCNGNAR